jgi:ribonuclease HI
MEKNKIIIFCDGGSRGNPGPAAIGVVIEIRNEKGEMREYSKFLGEATNNEAEHQAVIFALKKAKQVIGKAKAEKTAIEIIMDSELVVNQLNGKFKIKEKDLIPFFIEIWNLKQDFGDVKFTAVPREKNKEADRLVNKELDRQEAALF